MVFVLKFFMTFPEVNKISQCYGLHVSRAANKFHPKQLFDIVVVAHCCGLLCVGRPVGFVKCQLGTQCIGHPLQQTFHSCVHSSL